MKYALKQFLLSAIAMLLAVLVFDCSPVIIFISGSAFGSAIVMFAISDWEPRS